MTGVRMTINAHELGVKLGAWNGLVRRARMADRQKLAALTVSSYAEADGTGIFLTPPRLAVDLGVSYSTARRYLAWLRDVGLIELVRSGNRRMNTASEYRLIVGPDVMEHLDVLSPSEVRALTDEMRETEREGTRGRVGKMRANRHDQRSPRASVDEPAGESESAESPGDQRSAKVSVKEPINAQSEVDQRSPLDDLHTFPYTPSRKDPPSRADEEDLQTASRPPRARDPDGPLADVIPMPSPAKRASRAQAAIDEASARVAARRAAHQARLAAGDGP